MKKIIKRMFGIEDEEEDGPEFVETECESCGHKYQRRADIRLYSWNCKPCDNAMDITHKKAVLKAQQNWIKKRDKILKDNLSNPLADPDMMIPMKGK